MTTVRLITTASALCFALHLAKAEEPKETPDPTTIAELAPKPIPEEQNAAVHLERILPELESFGKAYGAYINSPDGEDFESRIGKGQPPTTEQLAAVRNILDDHAVIFEAIEKAAACDAYGSQLDFTLSANELLQQVLDRTQRIRILGRAVDWKNIVLLSEGKVDDAVRLATQALRILRLRNNEPLSINYLVNVAVHGVVIDILKTAFLAGPTTPEIRTALLAELDAQETPWLPSVLQTERAFVLQRTWDKGRPARGPRGEIAPNPLQWPVLELAAIDRARNIADRPWYSIREQFGQGGKNNAAMDMTLRFESRRITFVRCLRTLIAMKDYQDRTGEDATSIDHIGLAADALIDPFSGNPLKLKSTAEAWVIYTVMENGVDDGGSFKNGLDWGLALPKYEAR